MIEILSSLECDGGEGIKLVVEKDGVKNNFVVAIADFLENPLGGAISDTDFEWLENAAKRYGARKCAIRILAVGQCSRKRLCEKLTRRGYPYECAKNASDFVAECGYIDERWQIESYLRDLLEKRYIGRKKLVPMLLAKGYGNADITAVLDENYSDGDFALFKKKFLEHTFGKCRPDTKEEAVKMKKALQKQGY